MARRSGGRRGWSLKDWHWISSAVCLIGMLLFSVTGITLNHAGWIESVPSVESHESSLPQTELDRLANASGNDALPTFFHRWYEDKTQNSISSNAEIEWSDYELYVAMPRPGGDSWFSVDLTSVLFILKPPIAAGLPISMTSTKPAIPVFSGAFSLTYLPLPAFYSQLRGYYF